MALETEPLSTAKRAAAGQEESLVPISSSGAELYPFRRLALWLRDLLGRCLGVLGILSFLLAWEVGSRSRILDPFYFPPFSQIVAKGVELFATGAIWEHMIFSLMNFSAGFAAAVVVGVLAGVPMGWYKGISRTFDPLLSGIYATPLIALLPLIIMLFGLGAMSKIIMTFLAAVFPMLINTMTGIANTDVNLIRMSRSFGARDTTIFLKVSIPGSLPYIVSGMRVALGRALVYIVVAEQYGAAMGLGYLSSVAAQRFQIATMFVPIVIIACLGAGLTELLKVVERRLEKWKPAK
ncbi:MAG: ABC transporter permease [Deltaproteobacteria bacterium]|nr:ABC transporter permease [Deltaproteobacteria bacterium]